MISKKILTKVLRASQVVTWCILPVILFNNLKNVYQKDTVTRLRTSEYVAASRTRELAKAYEKEWLPSEQYTFVLQKDGNASFFFAEDNSENGIDGIQQYIRDVEYYTTELFHHILETQSASYRGSNSGALGSAGSFVYPGNKIETQQVVLDIGANRGYYSFLSASYGYTVHAFDPQPHCSFFINGGVLLNGFSDLVHYKQKYVSSRTSQSLPVHYRTGCHGKFPNDKEDGSGKELQNRLPGYEGWNKTVQVRGVRLDDEFRGEHFEVVLMKIDVEGHEHDVLRGGKSFLKRGMVRNIIMELNHPMMARQREGFAVTLRKTRKIVRWLVKDLGYRSKISKKGSFLTQDDMTLDEWDKYLGPNSDPLREELNVWFWKS